MVKTAEQRWFESCLRNFNRRKEEELTKAWSQLILKGAAIFFVAVLMIKWLVG